MAWIKRNLYFLIGSLVAVALMVVGGFMLYSRISDQSQASDDIDKQFAELQRLTTLNPHPGDDKIDNIKIAKEQEAGVRAYIGKMRPFFQRITPIPDPATNRISNADFAAQLRITVAQLHHDATQQSVTLPKDYYFTFESQKKIMNFEPSTLDNLAVHLGDIKVISELLFEAKVNSLDSIRRETISINDNTPSDYLPMKTVSTPLADHTPYELTFRCFSAELALVLANFANSPYGIIVKAINVEPAAPTSVVEDMTTSQTTMPTVTPMSVAPGGDPRAAMMEERRRMMMRGQNGAMPAVAPGTASPAPTTATSKNGQVFLTENPFRVTVLLDVVKLKSAAR